MAKPAHALFCLLAAGGLLVGTSCTAAPVRPVGVPADVLPEYQNQAVTALTEDCESVRMALGAAWDDALACRAYSAYLRPWTKDDRRGQAEAIAKRGTKVFEKLYCIDHGIQGVRFGRDTRDEPQLADEVKFWRNELALAAKEVLAYSADAAALKASLGKELTDLASAKGISSQRIAGIPWQDAQREAWRKAGVKTGVRLPLEPDPNSPASWWAKNLSLEPPYVAPKLRAAGEVFFSPEKQIGAWGHNCTGPGQYDWTGLNRTIRMVKDRGGKFLLELPTLHKMLPGETVLRKQESWIWTLYAPPLPAHLAGDANFSLITRDDSGQMLPWGGVQLFSAATARAYGEYLKAMAEDLKKEGLYDTILAVHLEMGDSAELPEEVDYSAHTRARWQKFMMDRYGDIAGLNRAAGTQYKSFDEMPVPFRSLEPKAADPWKEFLKVQWQKFLSQKYKKIDAFNKAAGTNHKSFEEALVPDELVVSGTPNRQFIKNDDLVEFLLARRTAARDWGGFLMNKYRPKDPATQDGGEINRMTVEAIRQALGDDYQDGYEWRLPFDYPPVIKIDYLHFRRAWVQEYLAVKRKLVEQAFGDKLIIAEMRQMGDHDGIAGKGERKWGGFLADDMAQFSGVGPHNDRLPFMIRSVGPPGFGTRPSDSIESLFRDYLWINFRDPGNLLRYFYAWVAHGYLDYQLGWHGITNHWLTNRLIYQLGPTVANTAPQPERIGLLLPRSTFDLFDGPIYYEYLGWDWLLHAAKLPYTRIDEHCVREGKLKGMGLEVLILPDARAMDEKLAAQIEKWVAGGGTLICSTIPGKLDIHGRAVKESALAKMLGVGLEGTVSEPVRDTPLTVTIPRGIYSGGWAQSTTRRPAFEALDITSPETKVLASYEKGFPAITVHPHGKGKAVVMGYPFGREAVEADRTSVAFYRTYTAFAREPQLVARTAWLRKFIVDDLGYRPDYGVEYAEVQRFKGKEAQALGLSVLKGFSQDPNDWFYVRTVGDPRADHETVLERETPDLAIRFYPRHREGVATKYLGISTREVHYIGPRGTVNILLSQRTYKCRINNPRIQAIWDVGRDVPVGFERDKDGVSLTVSLPSGHIMMLAYSETPKVDLFGQDPFPGRDKEDVLARCKALAGGTPPPPVVILNEKEIRAWLEALGKPVPLPVTPGGKPAKPQAGLEPGRKETVLISYGDAGNRPAAEKLAAFLRETFGIDAQGIEQAAVVEKDPRGDQNVKEYDKVLIFIGSEWTNNDLALHGSYWNWGNTYGGHLPFTTSYAWPGKGRAVIALSRRYALIDSNGRQVGGGYWNREFIIRPVKREFRVVRQKLHVAADGDDAAKAVDALIRATGR